MGKDVGWKGFFSDNERYADVINGIGCNGMQVVQKEDLHELDTQAWDIKTRDCVRKVAYGINFAIIGIENQDTVDYSIPLRSALYDVGMYEKQATKIRKEVRANHEGLSAGEYLYGFRKDSRLYPSMTFVIYSGAEPWDGPATLHDILDFADIPENMRQMVADYKINLVEIRKMKDTSMFKTDVRQVFDFIRCASDRDAMKKLVEQDDYYKNMEEDAFKVAVQYTNATELIEAKEYHGDKGGIDMCQALKELIAEGREEGRDDKLREQVEKKVKKGLSVAEIADMLEEREGTIERILESIVKK